MKQIKSILIFVVALGFFYGCETSEKMGNVGDQVVLSYPAAPQFNLAASGINFWNKGLIDPDLGKETDTLVFSLNIPQAKNQQISVSIGIDESAVAEANSVVEEPDNVPYALMPSEYYDIVDSQVTFQPGETDKEIRVAIRPVLFDVGASAYILPISIVSADGIRVSTMNTAYVHVHKDPNPPLSRANWTVVDFDSEEASGEGPDNGRVIHMFDNNNNSFWHTQWQGAQPGLPHWFIVDMGEEHILNGILILPRQGVGNPGRPKDMIVEGSVDGTSWDVLAEFTFPDEGSQQKIFFDEPSAPVRFFRVTVNSTYGDTYYTNIAELKMF